MSSAEPPLRQLGVADAALVVAATRRETAPALWGPRPAGPYTLAEAEAALAAWTPEHGQVSYGLLRDGRLVGAFGLMVDSPDSAELAYWVPPEHRRRGYAALGVAQVTALAHAQGRQRVWLEIEPGNVASLGVARRAGYRYEQRLARHCRSWVSEHPDLDEWHDCLIWVHELASQREAA